MRYRQIKHEEIKAYEYLAPSDILEAVRLRGFFGIGAATDEGEAAGLIVFGITDGLLPQVDEDEDGISHVRILWIYVKEEYRGLGTGTQLMEHFFDAVSGIDGYEVCVYIPPLEEHIPLIAFFEDFSFRFEEGILYEQEMSLSDIAASKPLASNHADHHGSKGIAAFKDAKKSDLERILSRLPSELGVVCSICRDAVDEEVSCILSDGEDLGMFLAAGAGHDTLIPLLLWTDGGRPERTLGMLRWSLKRAIDIYPPETRVKFFVRRRNTGLLLDHLFPMIRPWQTLKGTFRAEKED